MPSNKNTPSKEKNTAQLQSVTNALAILRLFEGGVTDLGVSEISRQLGISKATAFRLVSTLAAEGFLDQSPAHHKYYLSPIYLHLAQQVQHRILDRTNAVPYIQKLAETVQESVHLFEFFHLQAICIQEADGGRFSLSNIKTGSIMPLHSTASGKAMLALRKGSDTENFFRGKERFEQFTSNTITDPAALREDLEQIRVKGYAVEHEECIEGMSSLAVPIFNFLGDAIFALDISSATTRMKRNQDYYLAELQKTAAAISKTMGYTARRALAGN